MHNRSLLTEILQDNLPKIRLEEAKLSVSIVMHLCCWPVDGGKALYNHWLAYFHGFL